MAESSSTARRLLPVLLAALLIPIVPFAVVGELPGDRWLQAQGDDALGFGLAGAALLAADVLLPIPSSIIGALLGGRLGFAAGALWTFLGLCAGNLIGYGLGRLLPGRWASELPRVPTLGLLFLSRPVPVLAEAAALAAGAQRVPLPGFAGACALGNAVYAAAMAGNGAALLPAGLAGPGLLLPMLLPVAAYLLWQRARPGRREPPTWPARGPSD